MAGRVIGDRLFLRYSDNRDYQICVRTARTSSLDTRENAADINFIVATARE